MAQARTEIRTFYDELGVGREAGTSDIKRAFKDIAKVYHPDLNPPDKQDWAHEKMSRLNFIVDTLLDEETRAEYDQLVDKYELGMSGRPKRTARQEEALQREYARTTVEIMNLEGRYSNCRLKMMFGSLVSGSSLLTVLLAEFTSIGTIMSEFLLAFIRFFILIGLVMALMGLSDFMGRRHYRRRIHELAVRLSELRRRMYETSRPY
jgi:curved DNA-binding protein CbpA